MTAPAGNSGPQSPRPAFGEGIRFGLRLARLLAPHSRRIAKGLSLSLAASAVGLIAPLFSKMLFDDVLPQRDLGLLRVIVLGIAAVEIGGALVNALRNYYGQVLGARISSELSLLFFNHVQHQPMQFFDDRAVGEIMSRASDLQRSISFITGAFRTVLVNGIYLMLVPPLLFAFNWQLALLALATTPLTTVVSLLTGRKLKVLSRRNMELNAETNAFQFEALSSIRVLKAAAAEPDVYAHMRERLLQARAASLRSGGVGVLLGAGNATLRAAGTALFSWWAWTLIIRGQLTLGGFIAFSAYRGYLSGPVGEFASLFVDFQQVTVSLSRFFEYFDKPTEQDPATSVAGHSNTEPIRGGIEFRNVTFGYGPAARVLTDVSFRIESGKVTALVGRSGAGKSSIIKLILRMYEAENGSIVVGDVPINRLTLPHLRGQIGVVWQENTALRGSLRDNLLLGAAGASDAELHAALRVAQLEEFVQSLPAGLDTPVAEWGGTLSGGQRQRLAIARALARPNSILLFDEATSNLDTATEQALLRAVFTGIRGRTVVIATHRLVAASLADSVYVVGESRVTGGLPHAEMLASHDGYRALWFAAAPVERDDPAVAINNLSGPETASLGAHW